MTENKEAGTSRDKTIDSNGNIVDLPYGVSRWATPKRYECKHDGLTEEGCSNRAVLLVQGPWPHNCCAQHGKEWGLE